MKLEKLTLRLEEDLIVRARRVAQERGTSVSRMVAGFFESIEDTPPKDRHHGEITRRLRGSIRPNEGGSHNGEEDHLRHLEHKHG